MTDWIDYLLRDARVVELRHHDGERWRSGLFDDASAMRAAACARMHTGNLYTTVNRPGDAVVATNAMGSLALKDDDFSFYTRLLFDFDPCRPKGLPSSDVEQQAAIAAARTFMSTLVGLGWPAPVIAQSGNGAHLCYRVHLPVDSHFREVLTVLYRGLMDDFSTPSVQFDVTVRNPSRIWRMYGTQNRKGTSTLERPHRMAAAAIPARWDFVSPRHVEALAGRYWREPTPTASSPRPVTQRSDGRGDYRSLDVVTWFKRHLAYRRPLGLGKHAVVCPWEIEHSNVASRADTSTVVWEASSNWPSFHCSHAHCEGRRIRDALALWADADAFCAQDWARNP